MFKSLKICLHRALEHINERRNLEVNAVNLCGGVSCNSFLQNDVKEIADIYGLRLTRSPPSMCTDNAAMIAWMGWELLHSGKSVNIQGLTL